MTLHLYFARKFFMSFLTMTAIFMGFLVLVDFVDQLRRYGDSVSLAEIFGLTLLNAPEGLYQILPLIIILATITMFLAMARSSELVIARASGRAGLVTLMAPVGVALIIGISSVAIGNPIVAAASKQYNQKTEELRSGGTSVFSVGAEGLWLRQGSAESQMVIRANSSNSDGTTLFDVNFFEYDPNSRPTRRVYGQSASLDEFGWLILDAKEWRLDHVGTPDENATEYFELRIPSTLTPDSIKDGFGDPSAIAIWDLPDYIGQMQAAGFASRRYVVWLNMELSRPLFLVAMVLVGAAFTMRHARFGRTGIAILAAIMLGFSLYYIRNFAQILGENGQLAAIPAAWVPPIASILLALGLILHMEDG